MKTKLLLILLTGILFSFNFGCGGGKGSGGGGTTQSLTTFFISPPSATVVSGALQVFTVKGYDQNGAEVSFIPVFTVTPSELGTITILGQNGIFTAKKKGTGTIKVTGENNITATASITVITGPLNSLVISPTEITLYTGETQQFTVYGVDTEGNAKVKKFINVLPIWFVIGNIGTIDNNGLFTATNQGTGQVKATAQKDDGTLKSITADVTVVNRPPDPSNVRMRLIQLSDDRYGVEITWNKINDPTVVYYNVYRCEGIWDESRKVKIASIEAKEEAKYIDGLPNTPKQKVLDPTKQYSYKVTAVTSKGAESTGVVAKDPTTGDETIRPLKRTILTITISFVGNVNSSSGYYYVIFDNDNNIENGPYINTNISPPQWSPNTTHFIRLKDGVFRFGSILTTGEPLTTASYIDNKIIIRLDISILGSPNWLQMNVVTFDKDSKVIDTLDKNREIKNAYISFDITNSIFFLEEDNENDVSGENNQHLDIKEVKIEKSII